MAVAQTGLDLVEITSTETRPEDHPLWELQVSLERGMMREGADRVRERVMEAQRRGQMTRLSEVRHLADAWLPGVAEGLREWLRVMKAQRGPQPIALPLLDDMDPYVAGLIAVRLMLDGLGTRYGSVTTISVQIGRTIEHEKQVRLWEASEPKLFRSVQRYLDRTEATDRHRSVVNIHYFNALMRDGKLPGEPAWTLEQQFRVGVVLIDTVVRITQWFELRDDPNWTPRRGKKDGPRKVLAAKPGLEQWLAERLDAAEEMSPVYRPTVMPPARWDGTRRGGYFTPYATPPRLIRFKASQVEQKDRAADEYDALDMPGVYDAIHFLQEVPWRVNKRVFSVMEEAVSRDLNLGGIPLLSASIPLPDRPPGMPPAGAPGDKAAAHAFAEWQEDNPEAAKTWKRDAANVYRRNLALFAARKAFRRTFGVAKDYKEFDHFYFPHMLDFRGRLYPIPVGLQPQGDDIARGLLEFAEGKPVPESAAGWLAVNLATAWGVDKVSFEDRIDWVEAREDLWRSIAADPLGWPIWAKVRMPSLERDLDMGIADKPWQALAAVFDWVGYLDHGPGYVSHAQVPLDGTCNGIQHFAAMTRDKTAGEYVNLVPGEAPRDIYKHVARHLQDVVEKIEEAGGYQSELATYWLERCRREFPRSLTKRQVMVLPYGGTRDSFYDYTREWLDEHEPIPSGLSPAELEALHKLRSERIGFLVTHMWSVVNERLPGPMRIMKWLTECARKVTAANQPILWKVPTGFLVRHFYGQQATRTVRVLLDGVRTELNLRTTTKDLAIKEQLQGIPPNFVHSQDAAALMLTINKAAAGGQVTSFSAIHDAYGTHAADTDALFRLLREAFVEVHRAEPLRAFRNACLSMLTDLLVYQEGLDPLEASQVADERLPPLPPPGGLDLEEVLRSDYFFA